MSLTPERLEEIRAQHAAGLLTNTAAELLAVADRLTAEVDRLRRDIVTGRESERILQSQIDAQATEIDHLRAALAARPTRAQVLEQVAAWLAEVGEHDTAHLLRHVEDLFHASAPDADGGAR